MTKRAGLNSSVPFFYFHDIEMDGRLILNVRYKHRYIITHNYLQNSLGVKALGWSSTSGKNLGGQWSCSWIRTTWRRTVFFLSPQMRYWVLDFVFSLGITFSNEVDRCLIGPGRMIRVSGEPPNYKKKKNYLQNSTQIASHVFLTKIISSYLSVSISSELQLPCKMMSPLWEKEEDELKNYTDTFLLYSILNRW